MVAITMPHGHTKTFYDADIVEDGKVFKDAEAYAFYEGLADEEDDSNSDW